MTRLPLIMTQGLIAALVSSAAVTIEVNGRTFSLLFTDSENPGTMRSSAEHCLFRKNSFTSR